MIYKNVDNLGFVVNIKHNCFQLSIKLLFSFLESQLYSSLLRNELLRDDIDTLTVHTFEYLKR